MEGDFLMNKEKKEEIKETGSLELNRIKIFTIIGEIEGHEAASSNTKATKYEHLIPQLAEVEENDEIQGALFLLNTLGGDVEAGLAIAEMIASLSKPTVSLVLGGSHSIGGPLAVATDYSFIVPSGTMVIHPVRTNGMFIGVKQSYLNMVRTQDRITNFISTHSNIRKERVEELMLDSSQLVKDVGTMLEGEEAVDEGIIDEVGGMKEALSKLHELIEKKLKN
jgi:ATP-dependent protease ClpP protease subunit